MDAVSEYLAAVPEAGGPSLLQIESVNDQRRARKIEEKIKPLLTEYFDGSLPIFNFRMRLDDINLPIGLWKYHSSKGSTFFIKLLENAKSEKELDAELKSALLVPANEELAARQLCKFHEYVVRLGDQPIDAVGNPPRPSNVLFFVFVFLAQSKSQHLAHLL